MGIQVQFTVAVKYKGVKYGAYTPFMADEKDITMLRKQGAIILQQSNDTQNVVEEEPKKSKTTSRTRSKNGRLSG